VKDSFISLPNFFIREIKLAKRMIEAFLINAGPTGTGLDPPKPVPLPVGGEVRRDQLQ
jgi:hypothetical protein